MTNEETVRKQLIENCRRVVIKAGTRLLTDPAALAILIRQIRDLRERGMQVILVSSGAVGTGMRRLQIKKRPKQLAQIQALASVGQIHLMSLYDELCQEYGFRAAQLLLTAEDLRDRERHLNVINCLEVLLESGTLPIINENDTVSIAELKFGDNDMLASLLASMTHSDLTVILTTVDGLRRPNPDGTLGERISVVNGLTEEYKAMARGTDNGDMSVGGMRSKLQCADILNSAGECLWIADGRIPDILGRIFRGEDTGTVFLPQPGEKLKARQRWLQNFAGIAGTLVVDDGAGKAVVKNGKSLLPSGVTEIRGNFERGSVVEILSQGELIAKGLVNFSSSDLAKIAGLRSDEIAGILGNSADEVAVHRNNMVVLKRGDAE